MLSYFKCFIVNRILFYTYNRNQELGDKLIKIGVNFRHNHIEKRILPKCTSTRNKFNLFLQGSYHKVAAEVYLMKKNDSYQRNIKSHP